MPKRYYKKRKYPKRPYNYGYKPKYKYGKRKSRYSRYPAIAKYGSFGLPKAVYTKLTFVQHQTLSSTTVTPTSYVYRLNSIYDPDYTGSGSQPYMRDQLSALYSYYTVSGCKVCITYSTDTTQDSLLTIRQTPNTYTLGDIDLEIERGAMKRIVSSSQPGYVKNYYSISKCFGIPKRKLLSDDIYSAGISATPASTLYLQIGSIATDRATSATVQIQVELTYYVKFWSPIDQSAS